MWGCWAHCPPDAMRDRNDAELRVLLLARNEQDASLDPRLSEAAKLAWPETCRLVENALGTDDEAAEILERILASLNANPARLNRIEHPVRYILRSVRNECVRRRRNYSRFVLYDPVQLEKLATDAASTLEAFVDAKRTLDRIREALDARGREVLDLLRVQTDWKCIAKTLGYKNAHSAEVQFAKKLHRALSSLEIERLKSKTKTKKAGC